MRRIVEIIKWRTYWTINLISLLFAKVLIFFGYKYDNSVIPEGLYCYVPDDEKNSKKYSGTYYIKPCRYYKRIDKRWCGCKYLGVITDDFFFRDQCKICGERED